MLQENGADMHSTLGLWLTADGRLQLKLDHLEVEQMLYNKYVSLGESAHLPVRSIGAKYTILLVSITDLSAGHQGNAKGNGY